MSRIAATFARLRAARRTALMPYLTVGYPERASALELVPALLAGGADMVELGVPFSDPLADGATIQRTAARALANGVTVPYCLETVAALRARGVQAPLILMGYVNPFLQYGLAQLCADATQAGADGLIVPDLPPEEAEDLRNAAQQHGLDLVLLVAPTTPDTRIAMVARQSSGFLYCVSLRGVTGARRELAPDLPAFLARVRAMTDLPLAVGFGISTRAHIQAIAPHADAAIVASALLDHLDTLPPERRAPGLAEFVAALRPEPGTHPAAG